MIEIACVDIISGARFSLNGKIEKQKTKELSWSKKIDFILNLSYLKV